MTTREPRFSIGSDVYHVTVESPAGVVLNWRLYGNDNTIEYYVAWSHLEGGWHSEYELTENKRLV